MTTLLIFGAGMIAGIVFVGIVLNLTILKQDKVVRYVAKRSCRRKPKS